MRKLVGILLLALALPALSQEDPTKVSEIQQRIELIAENLENEEIDFTTFFDQLSYYYEHPLNLNRADANELRQLDLLTDVQINHLLDHIERNGKLITIYELQTIRGFDKETIFLIVPFVEVTSNFETPRITAREMFRNGSNELFIRYIRILEDVEGFADIDDSTLATSPNMRYLGDPNKLYMRYRFKFTNKISWGLTAEKDAGEEFFSGSNANGFDFYSAHLYLREIGKIKHMALGDYHIQLGQGLTYWSGLGYSSKSADIMSVKKNPLTIRPYTSVDENAFMRGAATTVGLGDFEITGFYSTKLIDGNVQVTDTAEDAEVLVTSFLTDGIHGTPGQVEDENAISETVYGSHVAYVNRKLNIGVTGAYTQFGGSGIDRNLRPYSQFEFEGRENLNLGADYNYVWGNINLFGETARSQNGGMATINGALISLDPRLAMTVVHRNYQRNYQGIRTNAFGERSKNSNEEGFYIGLMAKPHKLWTVSAYLDQFKFPWLTTTDSRQVNSPTQGYEYLARLTYKPNKKMEFYGQFREEVKEASSKIDQTGIQDNVTRDRKYIRVNASYKVSEGIRLRSRVEFSRFHHHEETPNHGYLVFQDVIYRAKESPLDLTFRAALFDTDSYDSRIYAYENDVLYYFNIPAYFYKGMRTQLTLRYRVIKGIDVWLRYAQTYYTNQRSISSGLNEITGNTKSEIKAQVRFRF